jgi:hypothetical protein
MLPSASRIRPPWLPPEGTYAARPAGKDWDAVALDGASAWAVLACLERLAPGGIGRREHARGLRLTGRRHVLMVRPSTDNTTAPAVMQRGPIGRIPDVPGVPF